MKLGVIDHVRCGESQNERTLVWLPDEMTADVFQEVVNSAQREYLAFADGFKNEPPPNDYREHAPIPYKQFPALTVAQVEAEWAAKRAAWEAWNKDRQQARKTFGDYLAGRGGIVRFWEQDAPFAAECNWGHRHGVRLDYDATTYD